MRTINRLMGIIFVCFFHLSINDAENDSSEGATTVVENSQLGLTIKGNQELPNVLYIVPWKKGPENVVSPIQGRIVDEVYGPVEKHVFQRKVKLYQQLHQGSESQKPIEQ